jgi:hypothetical protein
MAAHLEPPLAAQDLAHGYSSSRTPILRREENFRRAWWPWWCRACGARGISGGFGGVGRTMRGDFVGGKGVQCSLRDTPSFSVY